MVKIPGTQTGQKNRKSNAAKNRGGGFDRDNDSAVVSDERGGRMCVGLIVYGLSVLQ